VLVGHVDVGVLRVFNNVRQGLEPACCASVAALSGMHTPHCAGNACRVRKIAVEIPIER
jgi:hypothetical protein